LAPVPSSKRFLIIDDNADGRSLLSRTLLRKFPDAAIVECQDAATAVATVQTLPVSAILVHRAGEHDGVSLIRLLRQEKPDVPIIAVSGIDRSAASLGAGATRFLNYDQWLMVGKLAEELLGPKSP
jgi:CheY-like chemotaxis protein